MSRPAKISIDLDALNYNLQEIKRIAPNCAVLAMVKSNAYGHGLAQIGLALHDVESLGVACLEEGLQLREAGVKNPIVLMEGLFRTDELQKAVEKDFTLIVHHEDQLRLLEENENGGSISVWLKIDTGMHRLGFTPTEVEGIYHRLVSCTSVKKPIGLMTHFSQSDSADKTFTQQQINLFNKVTKGLSGPRSMANSGGILAWPSAHGDWIRPGIMLYGASPFSDSCGKDWGLKPVMSFTSELIAIHHLKKGQQVGYGGTWICPEDMPVGVVAVGYGDGYPRHATTGTPLLVNAERCALIGRVAMDMLTVDLRPQSEAKVGDSVMLWGPELPVEIIASFSQTIAYELLTRIAQRVRVIVKSNS